MWKHWKYRICTSPYLNKTSMISLIYLFFSLICSFAEYVGKSCSLIFDMLITKISCDFIEFILQILKRTFHVVPKKERWRCIQISVRINKTEEIKKIDWSCFKSKLEGFLINCLFLKISITGMSYFFKIPLLQKKFFSSLEIDHKFAFYWIWNASNAHFLNRIYIQSIESRYALPKVFAQLDAKLWLFVSKIIFGEQARTNIEVDMMVFFISLHFF